MKSTLIMAGYYGICFYGMPAEDSGFKREK